MRPAPVNIAQDPTLRFGRQRNQAGPPRFGGKEGTESSAETTSTQSSAATDDVGEAEQTTSTRGSMRASLFQGVNDTFKQQGFVQGAKQAGQVLAHAMEWYQALQKAEPTSSIRQKAMAIFDLVDARFREGAINKDQNINGPDQQATIYQLYNNVVQRFPTLAVQPGLPLDIAQQALQTLPKEKQDALTTRIEQAEDEFEELTAQNGAAADKPDAAAPSLDQLKTTIKQAFQAARD